MEGLSKREKQKLRCMSCSMKLDVSLENPKVPPSKLKSFSPQQPVDVVGGGFSGLVAAYYLSKANFKVRLWERSQRWGGLLRTEETPWGLAEWAAGGILNSRTVEEMLTDLGVKSLPLPKGGRRKRIYYRGQARAWPLNWQESLCLFPFLWNYVFCRKKFLPLSEESLEEWSLRNGFSFLGPRVLYPALQGVYGGASEGLSASLVLKGIFEKSKGPPPSSQRGTLYPQRGMESLIRKLCKKLQQEGVDMRKGASFRLEGESRGGLVLALPAPQSAQLLKYSTQSSWIALGKLLDTIEYGPLATVSLFRKPAKGDLRAYGCLFPQEEGFHSLGVLLTDGNFHDPRTQNTVSERFIFGRGKNLALENCEKGDLLKLALQDRKRLYGGGLDHLEDLGSFVKIWLKALPIYSPSLERILKEMERKSTPGLFLIGNYMGGIGLHKILEAAKNLPQKMRNI